MQSFFRRPLLQLPQPITDESALRRLVDRFIERAPPAQTISLRYQPNLNLDRNSLTQRARKKQLPGSFGLDLTFSHAP